MQTGLLAEIGSANVFDVGGVSQSTRSAVSYAEHLSVTGATTAR